MATEEENMAIVRSAYEDGINVHDVQRHIDAFAPGYVNHFAGRDLDAEAFEKVFEEFYEGFPDLNTTIMDIFASGNMVAVRHRYRGTHTGSYIGFPPSGAAVEVPAHDLYRMTDDGKIAEEWVVMDQLSMLQQIGIIPKREAYIAGERRLTPPAIAAWRRQINSHESFTHDSLDSLGYDRGRVADPGIAPQYPLKVYLPRTTDDVVRVLKEVKQLGETLVVRSKGHSSNDLVLAGGGSILVTEKLSGSIELDESAMTVKVQSGQVSAELDEWLAARGLGLPIIGDHNHITVGGFASVGGISGASHWNGLFVDNVVALELVDWDGNVNECSATERPDLFHAVLLGLGRLGVIATLTLRVIKADKYTTYWRNDQDHYRSLDDFLDATEPLMKRPPADANMMRGLYADLPTREGKRFGIGMLAIYRDADPSAYARARNAMAYGPLHRIGWLSGRLPGEIDKAMKMAGFASVLFSPKYATVKNVESFSDKVLDATVGEPTRYLVALPPVEQYAVLSRRLFELLVSYRERHQCLTFVALYVKGIRSAYLGHGDPDARFCEVLFDVGIHPEKLTEEVLDQLVEEFDDICVEHGSWRYMHSRTTRDPDKRRAVDPNTFYADRLGS